MISRTVFEQEHNCSLESSPERLNQLKEELTAIPWRVAAPSWVIPAGLVENCIALENVFPEVALLFFETQSCLAYTEDELPGWLAELHLDYHVHLPLDLEKYSEEERVQAVLGLARKSAFLSPRRFVLHPPGSPECLKACLEAWAGAGLDPRLLVLENVHGHNLMDYAELCMAWDVGFCLDLGHMLAYNQEFLLEELDEHSIRMLHLNAPGPKGRHLPLTALSAQGKDLLGKLLEKAQPDTLVTLEVFEEQGLLDSVTVLHDIV
ncbi:cobamide remodeling phosphodiesterase CbiR [Desulfobaculum bizertense]|uniref:Sugar phosphate isomerase/epimerase n=1 Tax=Desulfobaculum bizertense DSM 18034 TaxID=1121442 RepID=A0A1T4X2V6_9BACT|nr:cobamide remodeling phosphodiesterase CbiR [Desulfobaculum bizertense]SKA83201.1 hypothetical protein SAMN02745702_02872 [Desulfobaculum bizertense DSM 18034]